MYKKVGTISSAAGLIFLGIWMIVSKNDPALGDKLFQWWYAIFILLGLELIYIYGIGKSNEKHGFNFIFIAVVGVFAIINIYKGVSGFFDSSHFNFHNGMVFDDSWKYERYNHTDFSKDLNASGEIDIDIDNAKINVKKSDNSNAKISGKVYYKDGTDKQITIKNDNNKSIISLDDDDDNYGVNADIYVPDGCKIKFKSDNIKVDSSDKDLKIDYDINADNGMITIDNNAENITTKLDNGIVNIKNKLSKNVDVDVDNGVIKFYTDDDNLDLNINTDKGICKYNDITRINSGIKKSLGDSSDKLKINVDNGTITASDND